MSCINLSMSFLPGSEYDLILVFREDGFDRTSIDKWIKQKESEQKSLSGAGYRTPGLSTSHQPL